MAFDREAYLKEGRAEMRGSWAALELMEKLPATPYRQGGVDYAFLLKRNADNIARAEAALELAREQHEWLEGKVNGQQQV